MKRIICLIAVFLLLLCTAHAEVFEVVGVTASSHYQGNIPEHAFDGKTATTWRAYGNNQWIQFDLGGDKTINTILIAWHAGHLRKARFTITVSPEPSGQQYTLYKDIASGKTDEFEIYQMPPETLSQFFRITGHGNNKNLWNSIAEVKFMNVPDVNTAWVPIIGDATASSYQHPNAPDNAHDGSPNTRWSAFGKGEWLLYEYPYGPVNISEFEILWFLPDRRYRKTRFKAGVKLSESDAWVTVFDGYSKGTFTYETYLLDEPVDLQFFRITAYGNNINKWNSISELSIYGWDDIIWRD
jgi:hypothetical protein